MTIKSGIYTITNTTNGKVYIGSTKDLEGRWKTHKHELSKGTHYNPYLQRSRNKYGEKAFEFMVLEYVDNIDRLLEREQYWMDFYRLCSEVYNIALVAGSPMRGRTHDTSEETRRKLSEASMSNQSALGCKRSKETRQRMSKAQKGIPKSEETRRRMSRGQMGNQNALGHKQSKEHKQKTSERMKAYWAKIREETGK